MKFDLYWRLNCFFSYYYRVIVMSGVWLQGLPTSRLYCGQEQNWWTLTTRLDSSVSSAQTLGNWTFFHRGWIRVRITIRISIMPRIPDLQWIASCAHLSRLQWLFPLLVTSLYAPPPPKCILVFFQFIGHYVRRSNDKNLANKWFYIEVYFERATAALGVGLCFLGRFSICCCR